MFFLQAVQLLSWVTLQEILQYHVKSPQQERKQKIETGKGKEPDCARQV